MSEDSGLRPPVLGHYLDFDWGYCRYCMRLVVLRPIPHHDAGTLEPHQSNRPVCQQVGRLPDQLPSDGVVKELRRKDLTVMKYINDMPNRDPREEN